uniref:Uncharacterized protein n=1 Tax=Candidatus Kentrum sp. UNK TaxID=2126344 RepID=A0A451AQH7_9GAMM|nr:MAG: hypothetical protein BECKUNK1418G_GA0071005_12203 [Candidatus Kentron sp. UNK]VFK73494.1 MAG: hypothetical protein BECKUNK1418H_GA0071006_12102 [Candidatus Kentron sp. UNK]
MGHTNTAHDLTMKQQPRRGRRVDKRSASTISSFWWMRCAYPPYAGTFFICWGDEILNMIVRQMAERDRQREEEEGLRGY